MSDNEHPLDRSVDSSAGGVDVGPSIALAFALVAIPAVIVGMVLFAVLPGPFWIGLLLGLVVAAVLVFLRLRNADQRIVSTLGGGLLHADGITRLENMVQGLSLAGGVEEPDITVLSDPSRNAMALRCGGRNRLIVTQGLIQNLEVVELEGVVAELLTRLKNGDAEAATVAAALFGQPILDGPMRPVLASVAKIGLGRLLTQDRDLEADRQAVSLTRYPPGLLSALRVIGEGDTGPTSNTDGLAHLWLVDPQPRPGADGPIERAPLNLRIDVLAEL